MHTFISEVYLKGNNTVMILKLSKHSPEISLSLVVGFGLTVVITLTAAIAVGSFAAALVG